MKIKFWGTRGSIPVPGNDTLEFGGNTPCVEVRTGGSVLILDAGSGIRALGNALLNEPQRDLNILLTHYHWDHIQGIPFFKPIYRKDFTINFFGLSTPEYSIGSLLSSQMEPKNFPISIDQVNAKIRYTTILPNSHLNFGKLVIDTYQASHPSPTLVYKLTEDGKSVVYLTDNELNFEPKENSVVYKNLVDFCKDCDYLIHDSMFDEDSEKDNRGWGHSSNISSASFALAAGVKNVVLFHYNPDHNDSKIFSLLNEARDYFTKNNSKINCLAAKEGLEINI